MSRFGAFLRTGWVVGILGSVASLGWTQQVAQGSFVRGDANGDGSRNISDAVFMLGCSFLGTECPTCTDAADVNDDGTTDVTDPVFLLNFLFSAGPKPPLPDEDCGLDPTADDLECVSFPPCADSADPDAVPTAQGDLVVVPIEHGSLVILWDGKAIYADPVGGAELYRDLPAPDVVVITHTHGDHLDANTLRAVVTESTVLVIPRAVADALASSGVLDLVEETVLANGEKMELEDIAIEAVAMYNLTEDRLRFHPKGQGNGYVIHLAGTRVYVSGDTEDIPEMRVLEDIALAFICMNLPFTMTADQAASAVLEFAPRVVYPYHYRGQDPQRFKALVEAESEDIEVRVRNWYP